MKRILSLALLLSAMQVHASEHTAAESPTAASEASQVSHYSEPAVRPNSPVLQLTQSQLTALVNAAVAEELTRQLTPTRSGSSELIVQMQKIGLEAGKAGLEEALGKPSVQQAQLVTQTMVNFLSGKGDLAQGIAASQAGLTLLGQLKEALDTPAERKEVASKCFGACFRSAAAQMPQAQPAAPATASGSVVALPQGELVAPTRGTDTKPKKLSKKERTQKEFAALVAAEILAAQQQAITKV